MNRPGSCIFFALAWSLVAALGAEDRPTLAQEIAKARAELVETEMKLLPEARAVPDKSATEVRERQREAEATRMGRKPLGR